MNGHNWRKAGVARICLRLLPYAFRRWRALLVVLAILLLKTALEVLQPWPLKVVIDNVLGGQRPPRPQIAGLPAVALPDGREALLVLAVAAGVIIFLLRWGLELGSGYVAIGFSHRLVYDLAEDMFGRLQRLSLRFHIHRPAGDLIRRATVDSRCIETMIDGALVPSLSSAFLLVSMFAVMWSLDPALSLLALTVLPLMVWTLRRFLGPVLERSYQEQEAEGQMYDVIERTLTGMPVVQAFGHEERSLRRFHETIGAALKANLKVTAVKLEFDIALGVAGAIGTAAIVWVGAHHVLEGRLTLGSILVFLAYLASLYSPLESLMHVSSTLHGAAGSGRRVLEVLEATPEVVERPGARPLGQPRGEVRFEEVTFGYEPGRPVLLEVGLAVECGETLAIVGPTGAGKSTLAALVPRLFDPWAGRVLVDGRDVREVQLKSLRGQVAVVLQEPFLFPLTVAENIAYGRPGASGAEVEAAARAANAHGFIVGLPAGYETLVGERGATLSGGERQRLAIARALLKDAPILILDEPTSALDAGTEAELLEALERLTGGRTTLIIAHRLSTIRNADRIVVMEAGELVEAGTHEQLLAQHGLYATFHRLQSRAGNSAAG